MNVVLRGYQSKKKISALVCADFRVQSDAMLAPGTFLAIQIRLP
jgi:hypothetical protein